ncbi:epoxide hydrolase 1 [Paenibacillus sp. WQ 127069]|uniref:Epoxide hydrolase 1 n=1 Tax=Paenibacillus baimaensis TaxID=2982185 RepID=A0ABT2UF67_9BACL|nr:epoxide hydrolase family protein [Paenibacillus sp. WQ 127069]MCU6793289.1 epoxide hydrolase 1 [Paenibacillus sp. WQ 127069]
MRDNTAVRPFRPGVTPESALMDLRRRVAATRWPDKETAPGKSQGVPLETIQTIARYWATEYDWRKFEAWLNAIPQFVTEIDGLDIQFIHVRSSHEGAIPMILTHGWSGSIVELLKVIDPLTRPTAYGAPASDAFHVVIPSLPGYGFSSKPTKPGWDIPRIARAWAVLMNRLGYTKYAAQGGDWGALVSDMMGVQQVPGLFAIHSNMPGTVPPAYETAIINGDPMPTDLTQDQKNAWMQLDFFYQHVGYSQIMGKRPQTLTGLADSPAGLAAFNLDHDAKSLDLISGAFFGHPGGISRDDFLDNITLYWLTNTAISAARLYWENKLPFFSVKGVNNIPIAISVFPDELYQAPLSWAKEAYPKLFYYKRVARGGHFAAWQVPMLFSDELRMAFRPFR